MGVGRETERVCTRYHAAVILKAAGNYLLFSSGYLSEPTELFTNPTVLSEERTCISSERSRKCIAHTGAFEQDRSRRDVSLRSPLPYRDLLPQRVHKEFTCLSSFVMRCIADAIHCLESNSVLVSQLIPLTLTHNYPSMQNCLGHRDADHATHHYDLDCETLSLNQRSEVHHYPLLPRSFTE